MNVDDYKYLWNSEKTDWVLVNTEYGYGIVNKKTQMALLISDDELESAVIAKMLDSGNQVYENINEATSGI